MLITIIFEEKKWHAVLYKTQNGWGEMVLLSRDQIY